MFDVVISQRERERNGHMLEENEITIENLNHLFWMTLIEWVQVVTSGSSLSFHGFTDIIS